MDNSGKVLNNLEIKSHVDLHVDIKVHIGLLVLSSDEGINILSFPY